MVWKINEPYQIVTPLNGAIAPVWDGRYIWTTTTGGEAVAFDFWGPYRDRSNTEFTRWTGDYYYDTNRSDSLGPKLVEAARFQIGITPISLFYYNGWLYAWNNSKIVKWRSSAGLTTDVITVIESGAGGNSDMVASGDRLFFVSAAPSTQALGDNQRLWSVSISTGALTDHGAIPGKKQQRKRHLVICNDVLWISSYNTLQVHKFNAVTGAYITSLTVNRDVEQLFRIESDVYVISALTPTSFGTTTIDSSMVSKINSNDVITHAFGIVGGGTSVAIQGGYAWFVNKTGGVQRTLISNNQTYATAAPTPGTGASSPPITPLGIDPVTGEDFAISRTAVKGSAEINITDIKNILITPTFDYLAVDDTGVLGSATVPAHLVLLKNTGIVICRLGSPLYWENSFKINQYAAVSTGGLGYKDD